MSDYDDDFMMDSEQEDYSFEFEDDDEIEDEMDAEQQADSLYYGAKQLKEDEEYARAQESLEKLIAMDTPLLSFKAHKQLLKILQLQGAPLVEALQACLEYSHKVADKTYVNESVSRMMDKYNSEHVHALFVGHVTEGSKNWYKLHLKYLVQHPEDELVFQKLETALTQDDSHAISTYQIDFLMLKLQKLLALYETGENVFELLENTALLMDKKLSEVSVQQPQPMAILTKVLGIVNVHKKDFHRAHKKFLESFKWFDEYGHAEKGVGVLTWLVLTGMIINSQGINPFEMEPVKILKLQKLELLERLEELFDSYQKLENKSFCELLQWFSNQYSISYQNLVLSSVERCFRIKLLQKYLSIYKSISFDKLSNLVWGQGNHDKDILQMVIESAAKVRIDFIERVLHATGGNSIISYTPEPLKPVPDTIFSKNEKAPNVWKLPENEGKPVYRFMNKLPGYLGLEPVVERAKIVDTVDAIYYPSRKQTVEAKYEQLVSAVVKLYN